MSPERLYSIFGANLLDDEEQLPGYEELVGLSGHKPWDCVGEIEESRVAILSLAEQSAWKKAVVVQRLTPRVKALVGNPREVWKRYLTASPVHYMPKRYEDFLYAYGGGPIADVSNLATGSD